MAMGYGWGYRGTVGHEAGAMVPGALLGLVVCLASGRQDWQRRGVVAGLCGAAGWAWGGSLSYMEQTFYIFSDSLPDVLYGYSVIFFLGALWAGCGGALLGLGLTEPRSELNKLARVFAAVCSAYFAVWVYWWFVPEQREAYETFTVRHFHDGDWLSATIALAVSAVYFALRPKDRSAAALFLWAAVAWWIGYGLLTKLGELRLAPLHRSESWGGVLGILIVLAVYLVRRENRAALMLCLYGCVGGGLAFVVAVFIHHPLALGWGPFANSSLPLPAWRTAEVTFGALMGTAVALGCWRLLRGGLAPPDEDADRTPLDVFSVFVILIASTWINFRRHLARLFREFPDAGELSFMGLSPQDWYPAVGVLITAAAIFGLYRYYKGDRSFVPQTAFGKIALVILLLIWGTVAGQILDGYPTAQTLLGHLTLWLPAAVATWLLMTFTTEKAGSVQAAPTVSSNDTRWGTGLRYTGACVLVPLVIGSAAAASMAMQDGIFGDRGRYRFGPDAYWRQTSRLEGVWRVTGLASDLDGTAVHPEMELPSSVEFDVHRNVVFRMLDGSRSDAHRWFLKNQYIWLGWNAKADERSNRVETPLHFKGSNMLFAWPPNLEPGWYLVLIRELPER